MTFTQLGKSSLQIYLSLSMLDSYYIFIKQQIYVSVQNQIDKPSFPQQSITWLAVRILEYSSQANRGAKKR